MQRERQRLREDGGSLRACTMLKIINHAGTHMRSDTHQHACVRANEQERQLIRTATHDENASQI